MNETRVYSFQRVREMFYGYYFPSSLTRFLRRENIETKEIDGQDWYNADQIDQLVKDVKR